jgi:SPP1 Gp6-like portal protein
MERKKMPRSDLDWALRQFKGNDRMYRYALNCAYYDGNHRLAFATEKFRNAFGHLFRELSDNLCPTVVDAVADRMAITGFTTNKAVVTIEEVPVPEPAPGEPTPGPQPDGTVIPPPMKKMRAVTDDPIAKAAWDLWETMELDTTAGEIHTEMLKAGDSYAIVWYDLDFNVRVYPQMAHQMAVMYHPDDDRLITKAAKFWQDENSQRLRLNLYYPNVIEKYISREPVKAQMLYGLGDSANIKPDSFLLYDSPVPNRFGKVPVFHFINKRQARKGSSELDDVIPLQDALNKAVCDMLVAMEFQAYRQRWATGIEVEVDEQTGRPVNPPFNVGADRMITSGNEATKFGDFSQADLGQFLNVQDNLRHEIARVSGTPLHYFFMTNRDFPSGEALKSAEVRFTKKVKDRISAAEDVWENIMAFALTLDGQTIPEDLDLNPQWATETSRSDSELMDVILKKKAAGVSQTQLLKEMGYDDDQIATIIEENAANAPLGLPQKVNVNPDTNPQGGGGATPPGSASGRTSEQPGQQATLTRSQGGQRPLSGGND